MKKISFLKIVLVVMKIKSAYKKAKTDEKINFYEFVNMLRPIFEMFGFNIEYSISEKSIEIKASMD